MQKRLAKGVVWLLFGGTLLAQGTTRVSGTVRTETGELLPGANIVLKSNGATDRAKGTSTDGHYSLEAQPGSVFVISAIGYQSTDAPVSNKSQLDVTLRESASRLNEVIVVGYGTQDRKNLVGAVTQVDADQIRTRPVASFNQQLQGRAAGVQVAANTGVPGDGLSFRIRGSTSINASNDPLYVVDGVFVNNQSLQKITTQGQANNLLADINPADIESISILKDAEATAIYGARAANGVGLITTKRGAYNAKTKVTLTTSAGQAWAPKLWDYTPTPPCAFTPFATCPLPPKQNRLTIRIPAGEKRYGDH